MEQLIDRHLRLLHATTLTFTRSGINFLSAPHRLIGLRGARGTGKTTLLLQYARRLPQAEREVLYVSLDNLWFANNTLYNLAETFVNRGGRTLLVDEVHKYPRWAQELKNIYDDFPSLRIIFTGSSLLEIINAQADLSRRALTFLLQGLSFREFMVLETGVNLPVLTLDQILRDHTEIVPEILRQVKPLAHFPDYLHHGYYPFFKESKEWYFTKLENVMNLILDIELPQLRKLDIAYVARMRQLLALLAESVPVTPNITKLSERIGINRITLLQYIHYLQEAGLIINLYKQGEGISQLQKPSKFYLENTNLAYIFSNYLDRGTARESFFANQLKLNHKLNFPSHGDFMVDEDLVFEIGGKNKTKKQIQSVANSYLVLDDIEFGRDKTIPLWLFGFLY